MHRVTIYHNVAVLRRDLHLVPAIFARFPAKGFIAGDAVASAFAYQDPEADNPAHACDRAFEIGNVDPEMVRDSTLAELVSQYRAEVVRSVSVGDVVSVDGHAYAVASFGFDDVGPAAGLNFAGGRLAREVRDLIDSYEKDPSTLSRGDRRFVESLIV